MTHTHQKKTRPGRGIVSIAVTFTLLSCLVTGADAAVESTRATFSNTTSKAVMANHSSMADSTKQRKESHGILVERVSLSAGGIMVDVRYRILDLEKAQNVLNRSSSPQMIDQKTKAILTVPNTPKVGKLRQLPKTDEPTRIYWMFFRNTGGVARIGSKLTLNIGEATIKDLVVE